MRAARWMQRQAHGQAALDGRDGVWRIASPSDGRRGSLWIHAARAAWHVGSQCWLAARRCAASLPNLQARRRGQASGAGRRVKHALRVAEDTCIHCTARPTEACAVVSTTDRPPRPRCCSEAHDTWHTNAAGHAKHAKSRHRRRRRRTRRRRPHGSCRLPRRRQPCCASSPASACAPRLRCVNPSS